MINFTASLRIFVCTQPTDMRRSFDGLCGMVEHLLKEDPLSGHLFVFRNRARNRLKVLYWDGDGLAIWYKRLERGTYQLPTDLHTDNSSSSAEISSSDLALLLGGIDLASVKRRRRYQRRTA